MPMIWHGDKVNKQLRLWSRKKIQEAVLMVEVLVKQSMTLGGRTASGVLETQEFTTSKGVKRSRRIEPGTGVKAKKIGSFRSKPGEVPRVQTGDLRRNIGTWMHPVLPIGRVGVRSLEYGKWLEFGTRNMSPRPFMRPALHKAEIPVANLFKQGDFERGLK